MSKRSEAIDQLMDLILTVTFFAGIFICSIALANTPDEFMYYLAGFMCAAFLGKQS